MQEERASLKRLSAQQAEDLDVLKQEVLRVHEQSADFEVLKQEVLRLRIDPYPHHRHAGAAGAAHSDNA